MFPFRIKLKKKIKVLDQYIPSYLLNLKDSLNNDGINEVEIRNKKLLINSQLYPRGGFRFIGFLNECEIEIQKENEDNFLKMEISFVPILSLLFVFLPFLIISLLPIDNNPFQFSSISSLWFWSIGVYILLSIVSYVFFFLSLD